MKTLIISILVILLGTGCTRTVEKLVYVEPSCPRIEVLKVVPKIDGNVTNGCVCGNQLRGLFNGARQLRQSETYYIQQISRYNKEFTTK